MVSDKFVKVRVVLGLFVLCTLALVGCNFESVTVIETAVLTTVPSTSTPADTPVPTATSTATPTAIPTSTSTPTVTPSSTAPPTPTPTPTPPHPLMISVMREQAYPGSDLVIEETLSPGTNYDRYVVSYLSEELKIYAMLTVPHGEKPETGWPVIVFNHGYIPPSVYRTTERYVAYVDAFARNGYIVIKPDYRGHGFSEGEPSNSTGSPDYTVDVLNAMASVQRYPDADPDRVGMWGHSMGGSITVRAMVVSDEIKAGVIWAGTAAPYEAWLARWRNLFGGRATPTPNADGTPNRRWPEHLTERYGSFEENRAFWDSIDPTAHLDDLSGPLQLHHATADESVPVAFSEDLYAMLQETDVAHKTDVGHEMYIYEGDNHNISANFGTAMAHSVRFFDTHVKGVAGGE